LSEIILILCSPLGRIESMLKSLKNRILGYFILVALTMACLAFPLNYLHKKSMRTVRETVSSLEDLYHGLIRDMKFVGDFLSWETTNPNFFITGESPALREHEAIRDTISGILTYDEENITLKNSVDKNVLIQLQNTYDLYCKVFDSIVYSIYKRGYRDFGLEGEMLTYIYQAEKFPVIRRQSFELRRNERDYLNRHEIVYADAVNESADRLIKKISENNSIPRVEKDEVTNLITEYQLSFNQLTELDTKLGLYANTGLKASLTVTGDRMEKLISGAISLAREKEKVQLARINMLFAIFAIILFLSTILVSIFISRRLVNHLEQLTRYISQLSKSDFNYNREELKLRNSSTEIREIYKEFRNMVAQLKIREKQRDNALESVLEKERGYQEMADLLPQSIFETDRLGNIVYSNKAWHKAFGYSDEDIHEGLNLIEILQTNIDNKLFGINKVENSDYLAIRKDGSKFPALVYSDVIMKEGKMTGRRGIIIDATLRNKYIESLQKETVKAVTSDKLKSSFLANMSHEIRTPMNSIIGFANLLNSEQVPELQKQEFIKHIQSSGQVLLNLIDDIIDIAKIEAGEIKIKPVSCEPFKLIKELAISFEGYKKSLGKQHIELVSHFSDEEILFRTDSFRLRQILNNLVSNALKFTDTGFVKISCEVKNERFIEFSVQDTGIGLTREDLNHIFSRFKRTNYSEEKNISGTGLGLSISKNLVELLGGQMWVSSIPGEGTRFWFQLPYTQIPRSSEKALDTHAVMATAKSANWSGMTVLIAEDDDNSYSLLKEVLQKTQARVIHALNGKEVIEAVKFTHEIDLVLMDLQMPFVSGYDAAKEIKKLRPELPIIAQTAYAMEGDREKAILSGCDDYITKPIDPKNLLAKIEQFISKSKKRDVCIEGGSKSAVDLKPLQEPIKGDDEIL
jgi:PAS domain S-box-containing protein